MTDLLRHTEYFELATTSRLIARARTEIVAARIELACFYALTEAQRRALWQRIESREWFMRMLAEDYPTELEMVDRALEAELTRAG